MTIPSSGPVTFTDIQTEFGGTNPIALGEYYAGGAYVAAGTSGTYGAVPSSGQISVQNFYGTSAVIPAYIEEVFSTWLYTGTGSAQAITNGIDLSTKGGMTWIKCRSTARNHSIIDTVRGAGKVLYPEYDFAQDTSTQTITSFDTTGFSIGTNASVSASGDTFASWSFEKAPKFFDVVTYTGAGTANPSNISHNLGSTPGFIMVKQYSASGNNWICYHTSLGNTKGIILNGTGAAITSSGLWNNTSPTSTQFTVGTSAAVNGSGSYVAYLFAHNAGGFGATGTDNVISCGSYTGNGSSTGPVVTLGYEPQWVMIKNTINTSGSSNWVMYDNMRGMAVTTSGGGDDRELYANSSVQEFSASTIKPLSTGFQLTNAGGSTNYSGDTYIYIAIRRGPMKVPTLGTQVYNAVLRTGTGVDATVTGAVFPPDLVILEGRTDPKGTFSDRLRGSTRLLNSYETAAEATDTLGVTSFSMDGMAVGSGNNANQSGMPYVYWFLRRYPSVFDEVCYTGTGTSNSSVNHNLGVVPELFIVKRRNTGGSGDVNWGVYSKDRPSIAFNLILNSTTGWYNAGTNGWFGTGTLSSTLFPSGNASANFGNLSGGTYVAYLFATCPGVSKVGSYTGTGALQTVNCGFTTGARWVMVKRTDSTGDWYVWDSTRGMTSGNDPYLLLNANVAEVTGTNYVDTDTTGFKVTAAAPAGINSNGGTYIFLAIA